MRKDISKNIKLAIENSNKFLNKLEENAEYKLFERSDYSAYARCFILFTKYLIKDLDWIESRREDLVKDLNIDLHKLFTKTIADNNNWIFDKPLLQLLCFTLSSLNILKGELSKENLKIIDLILNEDLTDLLSIRKVDKGDPGSGNFSMFLAIINIYAKDFLNKDTSSNINKWISFNKKSINENGFWGENNRMTFLQFQNGYHQYEIFEYLNYDNVPWSGAAKNVLSLADVNGHFAPYPGGGGCYDYDAIFMLTNEFVKDINQKDVLIKSMETIISEQNFDGGFCESKLVKYAGWPRPFKLLNHVLHQPKHLSMSSLASGLNLYRYKHRNVKTHWTNIHRKWHESNAWDTFFRLSLIYRICRYLNLPQKELFKLNDFPGIG